MRLRIRIAYCTACRSLTPLLLPFTALSTVLYNKCKYMDTYLG